MSDIKKIIQWYILLKDNKKLIFESKGTSKKEKVTDREEQLKAFGRLLDIMEELRKKCPWDRKQTFETLRPLTIEETYELGDAILNKDMNQVQNELGDLLLHIVFYAKLGAEKEAFDIGDVAHEIAEKLIYRHPHIYGDVIVEDEETVKKNWEQLKLKEGKKYFFWCAEGLALFSQGATYSAKSVWSWF